MSLPPSSVPHGHAPTASADPRQIESWALTETALRMGTAQETPEDTDALLHAVRLNWQLWTIFQASLFDPDCPLPVDLRDNILSLCGFVDKHSASVINDPDPGKLDILISINRELASGLMTTAGTSAPATLEPTASRT